MISEINSNYSTNYYTKADDIQKSTDNKKVSTVDADSSISYKSSKKITENYYKKLCDKFNSLDITVGNYSKGATAGISGTGNLMINPEYLEKAAKDPKIAAKLENDISGIPEAERWFQSMCKMSGFEEVSGGTVIDKDGGMSSWSYTRTSGGTKNDNEEKKTSLAKLQQQHKKSKDEDADKFDNANTDDNIKLINPYQKYNSYLYNTNFNFFNTKR